eukprot:scaffold29407_cov76-Cyclotella_meneghiniana.AAC.1
MNRPNQSKNTESWGEKWRRAKPTLTPPVTGKHVPVTILEPTQQSPPYPTIHYTVMRCWKGIEMLNCKGGDAVNRPNQSKHTESWGEKWRRAKPTLTPPRTGKHVVVTILEPTQQSPPYPTIHYTYNGMLEG